MEERWFWCSIKEVDESVVPNFSRVPEERREQVEARWNERLAAQRPARWKLWGPQIASYQSLPGMTVVVEGPA